VPVDEFVEVVYKDGVGTNGFLQPLDQAANDWAKAYADDQKIPPLPGAKCSSCEFKAPSGDELQSGFHECWSQAYGFTDKDLAQGTVLDLWNFRKKDDLISQGRIRLSTVQPGDIDVKDNGETLSVSERQWMQAKGIPPEEDRAGTGWPRRTCAEKWRLGAFRTISSTLRPVRWPYRFTKACGLMSRWPFSIRTM
jgi:hypothetical protein